MTIEDKSQFREILDTFSYFPVISTISGSVRMVTGVAEMLRALGRYVTGKREELGFKAGVKDFGRGIVEMVPVIGNIALGVFDCMPDIYNHFSKSEVEEVEEDKKSEVEEYIEKQGYGPLFNKIK